MKLSDATDSVYLTKSMNRVQAHLKKEAEIRKVVPLKREAA